MSKKITLEAWAALHYDPPPSLRTLREWARDGRIQPAPQKVGRTYYVRPDAMHIDDNVVTIVGDPHGTAAA